MWAEALMLFIHRMQKYQSTFSQISAWYFTTLLGGYNGFNTETSDEKRKKVRLCQVSLVLTRYDIHSTQGEKKAKLKDTVGVLFFCLQGKATQMILRQEGMFSSWPYNIFFLVNGGAVHREPLLHHSLNCGQ